MELCGQFHVPAALPPGEESRPRIELEAELAPEPAGTFWRREVSHRPFRESKASSSVFRPVVQIPYHLRRRVSFIRRDELKKIESP
jgi:hypothetical protein